MSTDGASGCSEEDSWVHLEEWSWGTPAEECWVGKAGDGFSPPHDFDNKCSPPPSRLGDMLPDPGEAGPALLMTHHDALCDPWNGSEWVTIQQPPQPPHWLPSPADSEMGECSGKAPMIGGVPVADWTRACELLDGWFVPYWEGWTDTSQPPPARQPRFKFLWASDDPHQTLAVLEAAQQAGGPHTGQLVTVDSHTHLFLVDSNPAQTEMEWCTAANPGHCECTAASAPPARWWELMAGQGVGLATTQVRSPPLWQKTGRRISNRLPCRACWLHRKQQPCPAPPNLLTGPAARLPQQCGWWALML